MYTQYGPIKNSLIYVVNSLNSVISLVEKSVKLQRLFQLNKYETDPYFLQIFQSN